MFTALPCALLLHSCIARIADDAIVHCDIQDARHQATWGDILGWQSPYHRLVILALGVCLSQQLSGINTVIFYSADVRCHQPFVSPPLAQLLEVWTSVSLCYMECWQGNSTLQF